MHKGPVGRDSVEPDIYTFADRHIGPNEDEVREMLREVGHDNLDPLIDATVPKNIRLDRQLHLPEAMSEAEALAELRTISKKNKVARSFIGAGYSDCITPPVIQRNILENPGWYTAYTPYQAEIAQGRLEALLNFQTMITDLTAMEIANASLLDEATAAAEAMTLCHAVSSDRNTFFVADNCHPQTIEVIQTRAKPLGIEVKIDNFSRFKFDNTVFGALVQYPATDGAIFDYEFLAKAAHEAGALLVVAADIFALTLLKPPGEMGADVVVGNTQRFGVPLGFGGPHAAYFATRDQYKRHMPGRLVGVSHDAEGRPAYRLALQTREQHIRRDKATSNICTAQVLLAVIASMYAVYHGPRGLRAIAERVHNLARRLADILGGSGLKIVHQTFFDTVHVGLGTRSADEIISHAEKAGINLRKLGDHAVGISLDETTTDKDLANLCEIFAGRNIGLEPVRPAGLQPAGHTDETSMFQRQSPFLTHPVFNTHDTETEMLRYLKKLESRDLSLCHSMIPLGSCTMKLNATAEMFPISWPEFSRLHPFAPAEQTTGYIDMCKQLEEWLAEITGFAAVSLQPNAGSQGEYAGLLAIREYHKSRNEAHRNVCLIPQSAHGTNPASAVMAGFRVVPVATSKDGDIDLADLRGKADEHAR
ncbi:MAG: glycine dehydrogenase, partial [Verrucomicrobiota bacterium]